MQTFFTVLKAMIWGALLLFFLLVTTIKIFTIGDQLDKFLPDGTSIKVDKTYQYLSPKLETLSNLYYQRNTNSQINSLRDEIRNDIQKLCPDCKLKSFFPTGGFEVSMYKSYLESRSSSNIDSLNNTVYLIAGFCSLATIGLSTLLIYSLWFYRRNAKSLFAFIGFLIPIYFIVFAVSTSMLDDIYLSFKLGTNDLPTNFIIFSFIYFFIVYPAIYVITKKAGLSISKILLLKQT
jgi:hypothetical protein